MWLYPYSSLLNGNVHTHVCYLPPLFRATCSTLPSSGDLITLSAYLCCFGPSDSLLYQHGSNLRCQHKLLRLAATNAPNPKCIAGVRSSTMSLAGSSLEALEEATRRSSRRDPRSDMQLVPNRSKRWTATKLDLGPSQESNSQQARSHMQLAQPRQRGTVKQHAATVCAGMNQGKLCDLRYPGWVGGLLVSHSWH